MFLIVYVDDFKLAGPKDTIKQGWLFLGQGPSIEPESAFNHKGTVYLGCRTIKQKTVLNNAKVTSMVYGMKKFSESCLESGWTSL